MRQSLSLFLTASLLIPAVASAADIDLGSTTILRLEQQKVPGQPTQDIMPATQFLSIDANSLADGNLSLHLAGWGRVDLGDKSTYDQNSADGSLTYGYLRYRFSQTNADLRAGRFFVRDGIVNEQVDGVAGRTDLPFGFYLSAFGGAPVHTSDLYGESSDGKGDSIFGGRLAFRTGGILEVGFSGVFEGSAPDLNNHPNYDHQLVGGDIWLSPARFIELMGHTSYNLETEEIAAHSYLLNLKPVKSLVISGEYNEQRDLSYLGATWTRFTGGPMDPGDKSRTIGGSASLEVAAGVTISADYKNYRREFGTADRFGGDIRLNIPKSPVNGGIGFHIVDAGSDFAIGSNTSGSYDEVRAYLMHTAVDHFVALDGIGYFFKDPVDGEDVAWETKLSVGYHFTPALILSGDVSYGRNPQYQDETKGLIRLTYNLTSAPQGGKK
jgi:hypothetical protein